MTRYLLTARRAGRLCTPPEAMRPRSEADAYAVQARCMAALGEIGGWKVGAAGPLAPPSCAPLPQSGLMRSPAVLEAAAYHRPAVESEIAFVLGADLPPRARPYTEEEARAALASCHAGLEVLQSRFEDPEAVDGLCHLADLIRHGAYVLGPAFGAWQGIDFAALDVRQVIAGAAIERTGNPAGDMFRLVAWLANTGAVWAGGLRAGQIVTCGSWTGAAALPVGAGACARFGGYPGVSLRFA